MAPPPPRVRRPGRVDYAATLARMQDFTAARGPATPDELWLLEHPPVYTLGRNARPEHVLDPGATPVVHCDRGGQVTWHGPGQVVIYALLDLGRLDLGVRGLVERLEGAVIDLLAEHGITGRGRRDAPGVYVDGAKIAALGLRIRRGCSYHGLAFNVNCELAPFARINPCGHAGLPVTRLVDLAPGTDPQRAGEALLGHLLRRLGLPAPAERSGS